MNAHPAAKIFNLLEGPAFEAFKDDIREHGQREPIELLEGKILDGRNRERACEQLGIKSESVSLTLEDIGGCPYRYVASKNLHRRHLTDSQRALIAAELADRFAIDDTSKKQGSNGAPQAHKKASTASAAGSLEVGQRTVEKAQRVLRDGAAPVAEAVRSGDLSVETAEKLVAGKPDKKKQAAIVREAKKKADPDKAVKDALDDASFDTVEIELGDGEEAPAGKNGKPVVSRKVRKDCLSAHGALCRALQKAGIYDEFITTLSQIAERLKTI